MLETLPQIWPESLGDDLRNCLEELALPFGPDPYWPKWNNHWWRLTLLLELGVLKEVPMQVLEAFADQLDSHYLHQFPLLESELPADCDPYGNILCHCALGTAVQILLAGGIAVWERLPWLYDWLFRYQLPDGGFNCDEQAYTGSHKSSLVSTPPVLEAVLASRPAGDFTGPERQLLAAGLRYLLDHHLYQHRGGGTIHASWLQPLFPRFYEYDILRGLSLVTRLCETLKSPLPWIQVAEAFHLLQEQAHPQLAPQPWYLAQQSTLIPQEPAAGWLRNQPVSLFPLLERIIDPGIGTLFVTRQWQDLCRGLDRLRHQGLIEGL